MKSDASASLSGTVIVIDDNPIIQRAVYFALRDTGCKVLMCGDVTESLAVIRSEKPDIIVLDINFPPDTAIGGERDGFWALDWLRRVDEIKNTAVIVVSSDEPAKSEARAIAAGATAYFQKPINKESLIAAVAAQLAKKAPGNPV